MSPESSSESYPAFAHIGLRENPGKTSTSLEDVNALYPGGLREYEDGSDCMQDFQALDKGCDAGNIVTKRRACQCIHMFKIMDEAVLTSYISGGKEQEWWKKIIPTSRTEQVIVTDQHMVTGANSKEFRSPHTDVRGSVKVMTQQGEDKCNMIVQRTVTRRYFCSATFILQLQKLRVVFTRKPKVARCTLLFVLRNPSAAKVAIGGCESVHMQGATFAAAVMLQVPISVLTSQYTFCGYVHIIKKLMRKLPIYYLLFCRI
ncbi:hypothetical protein ANN_12661 [Periplaneta americana]|uniref:Uncharacterized protein n=1 Tax=Periplaneta americana TaxID=6978 RepID=A0ABQ8THD2_PERAM|nr:hypothetical protein ANN_12661 [Periplaneta americana]